jgi:hypothetical protein
MRPIILLFVVSCAVRADAPGAVAIRNARVIPVSGPAIERATVVLRDGLIEAVGPNVNAPADAWIIEGDGLTVYPGLIDALSTVGIPDAAPAPTPRASQGATPPAAVPVATGPVSRGPEDRPNTTSWVKAADLVRLTDRRIEIVRAAGFTTAITFPNRGIFAGQGAAIDLGGDKPGQMIVADSVGQYATLASSGFGGGFPGSLMGTIAYIRQIYTDADYYKRAKERYHANPRGAPRPEYDRALEGVLESPRILLPATRRVDVDRMLRFASELKTPALLYGLPEGYHSADLLKQAHAAVLVNLKWPERPRDTDPEEIDTLHVLEVRDQAPSTPGVLAKNGVKFAFYTGGVETRADLLKAVKRAVDAGLSSEDALRALTLSAAEIYGLDDRLGSVEKGKIANLVVTRGDLFQDKSEIKYVFVDGRKYEPVPEEPMPAVRRPNAPGERPPAEDMPVRTPEPPEGVEQQ